MFVSEWDSYDVDVVEPVVDKQAARDYINQRVNPTLTKALTALCKAKPADPVVWLANWLNDNNPNAPKVHEA